MAASQSRDLKKLKGEDPGGAARGEKVKMPGSYGDSDAKAHLKSETEVG